MFAAGGGAWRRRQQCREEFHVKEIHRLSARFVLDTIYNAATIRQSTVITMDGRTACRIFSV